MLPGRHPVLVAKQLATLAALAPRRVLPVFGLKPARPAELAAFPVPPGRRAAVFDDTKALRIVTTGNRPAMRRRCWPRMRNQPSCLPGIRGRWVMSRTTPVSAVPAGLMHRCPPPQTWAGRLRVSRLPSPPQPVSPRPVYRSVYGDGRWPADFCTPCPPRSCQPLAAAVVSRLAKRLASVGMALTRQPRARPSSSEQDGPGDPLATRSPQGRWFYRPPQLKSVHSLWPAATRGIDRRRRCIPRMSHAERIELRSWTISLGRFVEPPLDLAVSPLNGKRTSRV